MKKHVILEKENSLVVPYKWYRFEAWVHPSAGGDDYGIELDVPAYNLNQAKRLLQAYLKDTMESDVDDDFRFIRELTKEETEEIEKKSRRTNKATKSERLIKVIEGSRQGDNLIRNSEEISWSRKPSADEEIQKLDFETISLELNDAISDLDIIQMVDKEELFANNHPTPVIYIAKVDNHYYLINTEGYDYPRYMVELKNFA